MSQPNDMGDAAARPGLSAPEGASIPIALPPAVAFVDSLETGEKGWLNAMAWAWDEMQIPLYTAEQMRASAQAVAQRCAEICKQTGAYRDDGDITQECAAAIRAEFGLKEEP